MEQNIDRSLWGVIVLIIAVVVGILARDKIYDAFVTVFDKQDTAIGVEKQDQNPPEPIPDMNIETQDADFEITGFTYTDTKANITESGMNSLKEQIARLGGVPVERVKIYLAGQEYTGGNLELDLNSTYFTGNKILKFDYTLELYKEYQATKIPKNAIFEVYYTDGGATAKDSVPYPGTTVMSGTIMDNVTEVFFKFPEYPDINIEAEIIVMEGNWKITFLNMMETKIESKVTGRIPATAIPKQ